MYYVLLGHSIIYLSLTQQSHPNHDSTKAVISTLVCLHPRFSALRFLTHAIKNALKAFHYLQCCQHVILWLSTKTLCLFGCAKDAIIIIQFKKIL